MSYVEIIYIYNHKKKLLKIKNWHFFPVTLNLLDSRVQLKKIKHFYELLSLCF